MLRRVRDALRGLRPRSDAPPPSSASRASLPVASTGGSGSADRPPVYFHIGAPKTGTTFLQRLLFNHRDALRGAGVLFPGEHFSAHVQAAFDLRDTGFDGPDPHAVGRWSEFVAAARAWGGPTVFSQELFSPADPKHIDTAMADLDFARVHVVYTARELSRQIPAAWQEDVKNRFTVSFSDFVRQVREPNRLTHRQGRMFWDMQDAAEVLARWSRSIPPSQVHVVTVPPPGAPRDELWRRFASVIGLDPGIVEPGRVFENTSLGAAETAVLRRINRELPEEVGWPLYNELVKHHLAQRVLVGRPGARPIQLSAGDHEWVAGRSREMTDALQAAGYHVVGSLADLRTPPATGPEAPDVDEPPVEEQLDAAIESITGLLLRISRLRRGVAEP